MRKGPQTQIDAIAAPPYVKAIIQRSRYVHPDVLAQCVQDIRGIDIRSVTYCTGVDAYIAGELFVAHAYYGIGLTYSEIADYAFHSTCWVQLRVRSLTRKLCDESFVAELRRIATHLCERYI